MTAPGGKSAADRDQLREMLDRRARAVAEQTVEAGHVSTELLEDLERLARLVAIADSARRPLAPRRWPLVVGLGLTLLIISVLLFARTRETEIELDLDLAEASFVSSRPQVLANATGVASLGASGLREIQIPRARDRAAQTLTAEAAEAGLGLRLSMASDGTRRGSITLATQSLPAGTRVWLRPDDAPRQYRLSLRGPDLLLRAEVSGVVNVGTPSAATELIDFGTPKAILLRPGSAGVDIDVALLEGLKSAFSPQLRAEGLSLYRIEQFADADRSIVRPLSTIHSGTLYLESLNGQDRRLRPGEALQFGWSQGEIRTLDLHDGHVGLRFHGHVRAMTSGSGDMRRSLMPTYLEWLQARHGLSLLWGTTLYVFGFAVAVLRWWRAPE